MKKVYFCRENDVYTKKVYKKLKSQFPDLKIRRKGCLGNCKMCKKEPFTLINGKIVTCDTNKRLYVKIRKRIKKKLRNE